jgi:hypothetical protein
MSPALISFTVMGAPVWLLQQASGSGNRSEARPRQPSHRVMLECAGGLVGQKFVVSDNFFCRSPVVA